MAYYTQEQLENMGFSSLGKSVKISDKACLYSPELMEIGDYSRIDDFCVLSGRLRIGAHVHIAPFCLVAGGVHGIVMEDFSGLAYQVQVFTQSDDYSGRSMTNPTVPSQYKQESKKPVRIGRHVIIGAGSIVFPGVDLADGCSVGAMTLVASSTEPWGIYVGNPARRLKDRKRDLLDLERKMQQERDSK
ncbi:acyltransferase [Brachymonas sp. J145]|uniref:acyltransferase n=1 Tax=Brachymonas sp. J145 TaxID=3116489 RepID=UPI002E78D868|nr:acyltransferase [Brachymonas sp. J145]MEE1652439.1 acyltransferase [Brachymonas sp. J145]